MQNHKMIDKYIYMCYYITSIVIEVDISHDGYLNVSGSSIWLAVELVSA